MKCGHFKATEETMGDYYGEHRQEIELYNSWMMVGKRVDKVMREEAIKLIIIMAIILVLGLSISFYFIWKGNFLMGAVLTVITVVISILYMCYTILWVGGK